jgi:hypothetical protein
VLAWTDEVVTDNGTSSAKVQSQVKMSKRWIIGPKPVPVTGLNGREMLLVIESSITTGLAIGNVKGSADCEFVPLNSTPTTGPKVPGSGLAEGSHAISITSTASPWKLLFTFERIFCGNMTLTLCAIDLKGFSNRVPAPILVEVIAYAELETVVGLLPSNAFLRLSADNPDMLSMTVWVNRLCPDCLLISADLKVKLFRT